MNLNVGIDVSKLKLDYCGMDSNKQVCFQGEVTNTPKGAGHIRDEILDSFLKEVITIIYIDTSLGKDYLKQSAVEQAFPEFLEKNTRFSDKLFYFYHPQKPIVICGVHQNVEAEVNMSFLKSHGIDLVRRNSGGGAVYVDPGNLTYCYIDTEATVQKPQFGKYAQPIIDTLHHLGVDAVKNGRNDLTVNGRKFSSMSASKTGHRVSYGGTLMINVNLDNANEALTPSKVKLQAKGVKSVHSRVTNIRQFFKPAFSQITFDQLENMILTTAFNTSDITKIPTYQLTKNDWQEISELANQKYATHNWIYGPDNHFQYYRERYFEGIGTIEIGFSVQNQKVKHPKIFGDFLQVSGNLEKIEFQLDQTNFNQAALIQALDPLDLKKAIGNIAPETLAELMLQN
jgi:lipoate-protein ligase A